MCNIERGSEIAKREESNERFITRIPVHIQTSLLFPNLKLPLPRHGSFLPLFIIILFYYLFC